MKNFFAILFGSLILFPSCKKESIRGEGAIVTENRVVPSFNNIELEGDGEVIIQYGTGQQLTLNGYQNLLTVFETTVNANTLYLKFKSPYYNIRNNNIKIYTTLPALSAMRINGSGKMEAKNFVNDNLAASINGSGSVFIGNSDYNTVSYAINGSGDINAASTLSREAVAQITGSGNIGLKVSQKLKAVISGSGNINYWGNPVLLETQVSGSGKITRQ